MTFVLPPQLDPIDDGAIVHVVPSGEVTAPVERPKGATVLIFSACTWKGDIPVHSDWHELDEEGKAVCRVICLKCKARGFGKLFKWAECWKCEADGEFTDTDAYRDCPFIFKCKAKNLREDKNHDPHGDLFQLFDVSRFDRVFVNGLEAVEGIECQPMFLGGFSGHPPVILRNVTIACTPRDGFFYKFQIQQPPSRLAIFDSDFLGVDFLFGLRMKDHPAVRVRRSTFHHVKGAYSPGWFIESSHTNGDVIAA